MTPFESSRDSAVAVEFLQRFLADQDAGAPRSLAEYQAMFPAHAALVAAEFAALIADPVAGSALEFPAQGDRYRDRETIGRGGMGTVQRVFDPSLHRFVAMKLLGDGNSRLPESQVLARFLREAQITAQLQHPGIVSVFEIGIDGEQRPYFTMPLIEGRSLREVMRAARDGDDDWSLIRILGVLERVCEAVAYAHDRGVIHRDLKPANVMVGRFGEAYVVDWGLGRADVDADSHDAGAHTAETTRVIGGSEGPTLRTMAGDVVGTPAYMAPEQARGEAEKVGKHSDVYSLGAMLYHALKGASPYAETIGSLDERETLQHVLAGPPAPLAAVAPKTAPELIAICERAMARDSVDRYASASELAHDLRAFLENRVVRAYSTGPIAELRTWVRRNRALALAIAGTALALVLGTVISLDQKVVADRNAVAAEENFEFAFQAAEDLLAEVGLYTLENDPGADPMRETLAKKALDYYQRFAERRAGDPRVEAKVALSRFRLATLQIRLGRAADALGSLESARDAYAILIARTGMVDEHRHHLAQIDAELATIRFQRGDDAEAIAMLEETGRTLAELLQRAPDSPELLRDRAMALHNLGLARLRNGDREEVLRLAAAKLAVSQHLVEVAPNRPWAHDGLASGHSLRGVALRQLERYEEARQAYRAAAEVLERALAVHPSHRGLRWRLCDVLNLEAVALRDLERLGEAVAVFERAVAELRQLIAANPGVRNYYGSLAGSLCNLAMTSSAAGDQDHVIGWLDEALEQVHRALAIDPTHRGYRNYRRIIGRELGNAYLAVENHVDAARCTRELLTEQPGQHHWLGGNQLAACATLCSRDTALEDEARRRQTDAYADEAMQLLREGAKRGEADPAALDGESFVALRERADFAELVAELRK